jgi:hypothetical protein
MKIGGGMVIRDNDAAAASAVRKPPEDRRSKSVNPNPEGTNEYILDARSMCPNRPGPNSRQDKYQQLAAILQHSISTCDTISRSLFWW